MKNLLPFVIKQAEARLGKYKPKTAPAERSEKFLALDSFFERKPFGCSNAEVAKLVGIMTGWTPLVREQERPETFDIVYCTSSKEPWIVLGQNGNGAPQGFMGLDKANPSYFDCKCERPATEAEANLCIARLKALDPIEFAKYIVVKMQHIDEQLYGVE